jgi:hypothetical protein
MKIKTGNMKKAFSFVGLHKTPIGMTKSIAWLMILLFGLAASCSLKTETTPTPPTFNQRIYFQFHDMDYVGRNAGFLIDSAGKVYCYSRQAMWITSAGQTHDSPLSAAQLNTLLSRSQRICLQIPKIQLAQMISLIPRAADGWIPTPVHEFFDIGSYETFAFSYNHQAQTYQPILLKKLGEYRSENDAPEAQRLNDWLWSLRP